MTDKGPLNIAAQYLRMSTEHQQYSLANQSDAIRIYADANGLRIEQTYSDAGKSGLVLKRRDGLRQLLNDVMSGTAKYNTILVYDVSRWGRFQDADEAAHYEFLCKSAGMTIHYCAEQFANDNSLSSSMMKALKRVMAGEYSRELSTKVHEGEKRVAQAGFRTGGAPGYGLRRLLVTANREPKCILSGRERKSLQSDRVILVPGPDNEVHCVRDMFRMFTDDKMLPSEIAAELTRQEIPYPGGRKSWSGPAISRILRHPKYCGSSVFGQSTFRLHTRKIVNPRDSWTITRGAWQPLVNQETFDRAQMRFGGLTNHRTNPELLLGLRQLFEKHGKLSENLLKELEGFPCAETIGRRFGSLSEAFEKVGYWGSRLVRTRTRRTVRALRNEVVAQVVGGSPDCVDVIQRDGHFRPRLRVAGLAVAIFMCRCTERQNGLRWILNPILRECHCIALIARLNPENDSVMDLFVLPDTKPSKRYMLRLDDPFLHRGKRLSSITDFSHTVRFVNCERRVHK